MLNVIRCSWYKPGTFIYPNCISKISLKELTCSLTIKGINQVDAAIQKKDRLSWFAIFTGYVLPFSSSM